MAQGPTCPTCRAAVKPRDANPAFPFCAAACKLADLGRWLDGGYRIPGERVMSAEGDREEDAS